MEPKPGWHITQEMVEDLAKYSEGARLSLLSGDWIGAAPIQYQ